MIRLTAEELTKFKARFDEGDPNSCWHWLRREKQMYGYFYLRGKMVQSHKVSYNLYKGEIGEGLWVLHSCDKMSCINPNHLFLGTPKDNSQDMVSKGRHASKVHPEKMPRGNRNGARTKPERLARGEQNGNSILTVDEVRSIKRMLNEGYTQTFIALTFQIDRGTVRQIKRGITWRHII